MKAIRIHNHSGPGGLIYEDVPQPQPADGEVLVRVYATGVTDTELDWGTTWQTKEGSERQRPIPGHEFSGVIVQLGAGISDLKVGQSVYGLTAFDRDGSQAEYTIALPTELASKPSSLDYVQAASVPLASLTAWQALFDHAHLSAGQTLLIVGAASDMGIIAVQLARWARLKVIGVAAAGNQGLLRELGCDQTIDFTTTRFEDGVNHVDAVLDVLGDSDILDRSWSVLKKDGMLISMARPPSLARANAYSERATYFVVEPRRDELVRISELIDAKQLRSAIEKVFPLSQAHQAYQHKTGLQSPGKIVLQVVS